MKKFIQTAVFALLIGAFSGVSAFADVSAPEDFPDKIASLTADSFPFIIICFAILLIIAGAIIMFRRKGTKDIPEAKAEMLAKPAKALDAAEEIKAEAEAAAEEIKAEAEEEASEVQAEAEAAAEEIVTEAENIAKDVSEDVSEIKEDISEEISAAAEEVKEEAAAVEEALGQKAETDNEN